VIYPTPVELQPFFEFFHRTPENTYPVSNHFPYGEQHRGLFKSYNYLLTDLNQRILKALGTFHTWNSRITSEESAYEFFMFLKRLGEPDVASWIAADLERVEAWKASIPLDWLQQILLKFPDISRVSRLSDILRFLMVIQGQRAKEEYYRGKLEVDAFMGRFIENPGHYVPMIEALRKYQSPDLMPWSARIEALEKTKSVFGAASLVTNDEVRETLLKLWQPTEKIATSLSDESEQVQSPVDHKTASGEPVIHKLKRTSLKRSELESLKSQLQNGFNSDHLPLLRTAITKTLSPDEVMARIETRERVARTIDFQTHSLHPFTVYGVNIGFEIEADVPRALPAMHGLFEDMGLIGHHIGQGGSHSKTLKAELEVSPGPFSSAVAAKAAFNAWREGDLLDFSAQRMQTCHMNIQLSDRANVIALDELTMFSAYAYHPVSTSGIKYCRLTIPAAKKSLINGQGYFETKGFFVVNPHDFELHLNEYFLLGTAARASELLCETPYVARLKEIWHKTVNELKEIKSQLRIESGNHIPTNAQIDEILHVFPDPLSHYDSATRQHKNSLHSDGPNLVAATRKLTARACREIEQVMMKTQSHFFQALDLYAQLPESKRPAIADRFYQEFPEYKRFDMLYRLVNHLLPLAKPFLEPGNTLPRPI
jgi:hypothetical protein